MVFWQQQQLAEARTEIARLRTEQGEATRLQGEVARLEEIAVDAAELTRLRENQASVQRELARLRGQIAGGIRAETENTRLRAEVERQAAESSASTNPIAAPMAEMMKGSVDQVFRGRLARMTEKLNLSPSQTEAIEAILQRQAKGMSEAMAGVFSGKLDQKKVAELRQQSGDPETEIRALLAPEQQSAYDTFQEEERTQNARVAANGELLQMQTTLGLTSVQQDQVYPILYEQTLLQFKGEAAGEKAANPAEVMQALLDRKAQALAEVLTPEQLQNYRQQQERQIEFMKRIMTQIEPPKPSP